MSNDWPRSLLVHKNSGELSIEILQAQRTGAVHQIDTVPAHQGRSGVATVSQSTGSKLTNGNAVIFIRDAVPSIQHKDDVASRITSATLWLQHFSKLKSIEELQATAISLAFRFSDVPPTSNIAHGLSSAYWMLQQLLDSLEVALDSYRGAVPYPQREVTMDELSDVWKDITKEDPRPTGQKIRSLAMRRLQGKRIYQADRRVQFNKTLYNIRCGNVTLYGPGGSFTPAWGGTVEVSALSRMTAQTIG